MKRINRSIISLWTIVICVFTCGATNDSTEVSNYMYEGLNYRLNFKYKIFEVKKLPDGTPYSGNITVPDSIVYEGKRLPVNDIDVGVFFNSPDLKNLTINAIVDLICDIDIDSLESLTVNNVTDFLSIGNVGFYGGKMKKAEFNCKNLMFGFTGSIGVWFEGVDSIVCNCEQVIVSSLRADGVLDFGDAWVFIDGKSRYATGLNYFGEKLTLPGRVNLCEAALKHSKMSVVELPVLIHNPGIDETKYPYYIENYCFQDCKELKKLIVHDPTPWPASPEAFLEYPGENKVSTDSTLYSQCTLFVPEAAIPTYKADPVWGKFKTIAAIESGVVDVKTNCPVDEDAPTEYFTIDGRRLTTPEPGSLVIRRRGSRVDKIVVK